MIDYDLLIGVKMKTSCVTCQNLAEKGSDDNFIIIRLLGQLILFNEDMIMCR